MSDTLTNGTNITKIPISYFTFTDNIAYAILGLVAISLNLLIFAVLISDRGLLRKSAFLAGIALGNLQLGFYLTMSGIYRQVLVNSLQQPASVLGCISMIWPMLYTTAFNTEATFLFLSGLERFLAIAAANWFRQNWTSKVAWSLAIGACILILITLILSLIIPTDRSSATWSCSVTAVYGLNYIRFSSSFSCLAGLASATLTVLALIFCIQRIRKLPLASGEAGRIRKQLQLTKSMVTISCFEIALMAIPNFLSLLGNFHVPLPAFKPNNSTYTNAVNSMVALFAFMAFNSQFRQVAIRLLHMEKVTSVLVKVITGPLGNQVAAIQIPAENQNHKNRNVGSRNTSTNGQPSCRTKATDDTQV